MYNTSIFIARLLLARNEKKTASSEGKQFGTNRPKAEQNSQNGRDRRTNQSIEKLRSLPIKNIDHRLSNDVNCKSWWDVSE